MSISQRIGLLRHPAKSLRLRTLRGFSLVELMVAITIGLLIVAALLALYLNITRTNAEMAKANSLIENGRFAIQLIQNDLIHAGFWGGHVPQFDDLTFSTAPTDAPTAVPEIYATYNTANWTSPYKNNLIGVPVQAYDAAPGCTDPGGGCTTERVLDKKANTDVLVVRHAETCLPGVGNCEADSSGKLYFQSSLCAAENGATAQGGAAATITLSATASAIISAYNGMAIHAISGTGAGQTRQITAYDGATKIATITPIWTITPDNTTTYSIDVLDTSTNINGYNLKKRDCATLADKRKLISNIYYVRNYAVTVGDGIPTLMRSSFDLSGGTLAHQAAQPLIEGIEGISVEFGIDSVSDSGGAVVPTAEIAWADVITKTSPTNRGDGIPDGAFTPCTDAAPCTAAQLTNVAAVKLYVLARANLATPGYTDTKTYTLGSTTLGPFNDSFKRHVFSTTVRLTNISGRRETP